MGYHGNIIRIQGAYNQTRLLILDLDGDIVEYIYRSYIIYMRIWLVARVELSIQKGARPAPRSYERLRAGKQEGNCAGQGRLFEVEEHKLGPTWA